MAPLDFLGNVFGVNFLLQGAFLSYVEVSLYLVIGFKFPFVYEYIANRK
jgi:hypothetical protein